MALEATSSNQAEFGRLEDERLGLAANLAYGLQHILTMYGGMVAVPLIVGQARRQRCDVAGGPARPWSDPGNPEFSNEMARRLLRIRLDPHGERPW